MVRRMAVVPRTHVFLFQQRSAYIFSQKNAGHIDQSPLDQRGPFHPLHHGGEELGASVDGEHPEGRAAGQLQVAHAEGVQAGPEDFHGPADYSAS